VKRRVERYGFTEAVIKRSKGQRESRTAQKGRNSKGTGGATRSDALVVYGATGDLAHKMIFPALYAMSRQEF
jgi:hypothetical protein